MPAGRPTSYTPELAALICDRVGSHGISLKRLCAMYDDMPDQSTIFAWRAKYEEFSNRYLNARRKQAHILFETSADDIDDIQQYYYIDPDTGAQKVDSGIVAAQRAMANHKTFMASKICPKEYSVNKQVEESSPSETLTKIRDLVADLNKTNTSDI